jgi:hypothetical protein
LDGGGFLADHNLGVVVVVVVVPFRAAKLSWMRHEECCSAVQRIFFLSGQEDRRKQFRLIFCLLASEDVVILQLAETAGSGSSTIVE